MLDLTKYEGCTPGPWKRSKDGGFLDSKGNWVIHSSAWEEDAYSDGENDIALANDYLIADAPLLLAEVKRLREALEILTNAANDERDSLNSRAYRNAIARAESALKGE